MSDHIHLGPQSIRPASTVGMLAEIAANQERLIDEVRDLRASVARVESVIVSIENMAAAFKRIESEMASNYRGFEGWTKEAVGQIQATVDLTKQAIALALEAVASAKA
jgi:hypothetical protein